MVSPSTTLDTVTVASCSDGADAPSVAVSAVVSEAVSGVVSELVGSDYSSAIGSSASSTRAWSSVVAGP
jgi:hypothetical protein